MALNLEAVIENIFTKEPAFEVGVKKPSCKDDTMSWCFQCQTEYAEDVVECVECGVELVAQAPTELDDVGGSDEEQIVYELHEWAGESRRALDQELTGQSIAHSWLGATLVIRAADEESVDEIVEATDETGGPVLDPEAEKIAYEVEGWAADEQTAFSELLARLGIPHEFDEAGDLLVLVEDEDAVEAALDAFQGANDDRPELEGLDANALLSNVFVACDRLRKDPRDNRGVEEILAHAPLLVSHRPPFGFNPVTWNLLGEKTNELVDLLAEGNTSDEDLKLLANALTEVLRQMV